MAKTKEYRRWCKAQAKAMGLPLQRRKSPSQPTDDFLRAFNVAGNWKSDIPEDYQELWGWVMANNTVDQYGRLIPLPHPSRYYKDDRKQFYLEMRSMLYQKFVDVDGTIRFYTVAPGSCGDPDKLIGAYEDLLEMELERLGYVYDDYADYGSGVGEIDPNYCFVNKDDERRRLIDAPSYGC